MKDIELPSPLGYMNAGHMHELQQGRLHYGYVYPKGGTGAEEAVFTADQLRAVVEADRAQRVPDGWVLIATDAYEAGFGKGEQANKTGEEVENPWCDEPGREAWSVGYAIGKERAARASTPAPAQQEPSPIKAEHKTVTPSGTVVTRLELTDKAKESLRANVTHIPGIAQHQEPPQQERTVIGYVPMSAVEETPLDGYVPVYATDQQQERKRLTGEQASAMAAYFNVPADYVHTVYNRVHGIKE